MKNGFPTWSHDKIAGRPDVKYSYLLVAALVGAFLLAALEYVLVSKYPAAPKPQELQMFSRTDAPLASMHPMLFEFEVRPSGERCELHGNLLKPTDIPVIQSG